MDYKDIDLIPRGISTIASRDEIDTSVQFGPITLEVPIIASPMVDVANTYLQLNEILESGAFAFVHRFDPLETRIFNFQSVNHPFQAGAAICLGETEAYNALYEAGARIFCLDVANGANIHAIEFTQTLDRPDTHLVLGNVGNAYNYNVLAAMKNVIAVRVGLSCGAGCSTANATGIRTPMASTIMELPFPNVAIADGGIREPGDFCKAIALGAQYAMMGSVLAACEDSSANFVRGTDMEQKRYSGSASREIQARSRVPRYIEGKSVELEVRAPLRETIDEFAEGLRSCMSYFNARTIDEFQQAIREEE